MHPSDGLLTTHPATSEEVKKAIVAAEQKPFVASVKGPAVTTKPAVAPAVAPSKMAAAVNTAAGLNTPIPKSLRKGNTKDLGTDTFMHAMIFSETSARKTTTAAKFGDAKTTRFIITRRKEQLLPLKNMGYEYAEVTDYKGLMFALMFPERIWPEWAELPDRTLVIDDLTEAVALLLEEYQEIDGKEVKDKRRSYTEAGNDVRDALRSLLRKKMHLVIVALAKVKDNQITNEERIAPDLPPSIMNILLSELEFVFYINPQTYMFTTEKDFFAYSAPDPANPNKEKTFKREIFAKHKISEELAKASPKVIKKYEIMDLRDIWNRVQKAEKAIVK
jgi:hypothetical protein